jgi:hypothetical protein
MDWFMKRSDAAKLLRDEVVKLNSELQVWETFSMVDAFQLLNKIEKIGMLPPCDNSCKPENYPEGVIWQGCNNEWESEDE